MGRDLGITETIVWTCVALSLSFADIVIQWQDLWLKRPRHISACTLVLVLGLPG
jgi:hypothetical protein